MNVRCIYSRMLVKKFMIGGGSLFLIHSACPDFVFTLSRVLFAKSSKYIRNIAYCTYPFFFLVRGCCGLSSLCLPCWHNHSSIGYRVNASSAVLTPIWDKKKRKIMKAGTESWKQWGRRLKGWPNTAARRRVTQQVWFCTWWTCRSACLFRTVPVDLTGAAQLRADWVSSCCYKVNIHNHPSWASYVKQGRYDLVLSLVGNN